MKTYLKKTAPLIFTAIIILLIATPVLATKVSDTMLSVIVEAKPDLPAYAKNDPATVAGKAVGAALSLLGVLFIVLIIYGGYLWMTARGNEEQIEKAKKVIIPAIIGLTIILLAGIISFFIFNLLFDATVTT